MVNPGVSDEALQQAVDADALYPSQAEAARMLGLQRHTYLGRLASAQRLGFTARSPEYASRALTRARRITKPRKGVRRLIVTSAQDGTEIHEGFWANLKAYAAHLDAEILVGGFTYSHALFSDHAAAHGVFHHELAPHVVTSRVHVADRIAICAEMNTLPTAVRPLSGLATYSGKLDGVFPHAKIALESVAQPKSLGAKINVTTGAVTRPNYIAKKAGMKAQFHHVYGALVVEVDAKGRTWMRHVLGDDDDGSFYDIDTLVRDGEVTTGHRALSVVIGDIHFEKADPGIIRATFGFDMTAGQNTGEPCFIDEINAEWLIIHDVHDFAYRNHHNRNDLHFRFERWRKGEECVKDSLAGVARFLEATRRQDTRSVVVSSNHHDAFIRWLKEPDVYAKDPVNARFFLESQLAVFDSIDRGQDRFNVFEWALRRLSADGLQGVIFPHEDQSVMIGGVEHGMHGHLGPNGAKGSKAGFANMGPKLSAGHVHSPGIVDGAYWAGVCQLEMGYNRGASGWAVANIVQYQSKKRALLFMVDGRWRAS